MEKIAERMQVSVKIAENENKELYEKFLLTTTQLENQIPELIRQMKFKSRAPDRSLLLEERRSRNNFFCMINYRIWYY
jgi:hypothetical protein